MLFTSFTFTSPVRFHNKSFRPSVHASNERVALPERSVMPGIRTTRFVRHASSWSYFSSYGRHCYQRLFYKSPRSRLPPVSPDRFVFSKSCLYSTNFGQITQMSSKPQPGSYPLGGIFQWNHSFILANPVLPSTREDCSGYELQIDLMTYEDATPKPFPQGKGNLVQDLFGTSFLPSSH